MNKRGSTYLLSMVLCVLAGIALPVRAGEGASATMMVGAVVARHARIQLEQPSTISVTAQDIARGYVEVERPVQVLVRSNAHDGYTLAFECACESIRSAQVTGLAGGLQVGAGASYAVRPAAGAGMWEDRMALRFRFLLAADASPGSHAWPIRISLMTT